jgi:hypothetical protein
MRKSAPAAGGFDACDTGLHSRPATLTKKRFDEIDDPKNGVGLGGTSRADRRIIASLRYESPLVNKVTLD